MTPPDIKESTREERRNFVVNAWKCLHNFEICGRCHMLRGHDPETLYEEYIDGTKSYVDVSIEIRNKNRMV